MRVSKRELDIIRQRLNAIDPNGKIYLFSSRTIDPGKGDDIDIFFETTVTLDLKTKLLLEYRLNFLCDTKVDLFIKEPGQPERAIYSIARDGIRI